MSSGFFFRVRFRGVFLTCRRPNSRSGATFNCILHSSSPFSFSRICSLTALCRAYTRMLIRQSSRCLRYSTKRVSRSHQHQQQTLACRFHGGPSVRRFSSTTSHASSPAVMQQSPVSLLATLTGELDKIAPRFELDPDKIAIIQSPSEFYEALKVGFAFALHYLLIFPPPKTKKMPCIRQVTQPHFS